MAFSEVESRTDEVQATNERIYEYFIRENGLYTLRQGSEDMAEQMYSLFNDVFTNYESTILTIVIGSCVILCIS